MDMKDQSRPCEACCENTCANIAPPKKPAGDKRKKPTADERIYKFLDAAERLAIFLANKQRSKKKKAKKQLKKAKKAYKIDKKTGTLVLKRIKKDKVQKPMKRYKPPKKK